MSFRHALLAAATLGAVVLAAPATRAEDVKKAIVESYDKMNEGFNAKNLTAFNTLHTFDFEASYKGHTFKSQGLSSIMGPMVMFGKEVKSETSVSGVTAAGQEGHATAKQHIVLVVMDPRDKASPPHKAVVDLVSQDTWIPRHDVWKIRKSKFSLIKVVVDGKPFDIDSQLAMMEKRAKERAAMKGPAGKAK